MYGEASDDLDESPDELDLLSSPPARRTPLAKHALSRSSGVKPSRRKRAPSPAKSPLKQIVIPIEDYQERISAPVSRQHSTRRNSRQHSTRQFRADPGSKGPSIKRVSPAQRSSTTISRRTSEEGALEVFSVPSPATSPPIDHSHETKEGTDERRQLLDQLLQSFSPVSPEDHLDDQEQKVYEAEDSRAPVMTPELADSSTFDLADEYSSDSSSDSDIGRGKPHGPPEWVGDHIGTSLHDTTKPNDAESLATGDETTSYMPLDPVDVNAEDLNSGDQSVVGGHPLRLSDTKVSGDESTTIDPRMDAEGETNALLHPTLDARISSPPIADLPGAAQPTAPSTSEDVPGQPGQLELSTASDLRLVAAAVAATSSTSALLVESSAVQSPVQCSSPNAEAKAASEIIGSPSPAQTYDIDMPMNVSDYDLGNDEELDAEGLASANDVDDTKPPAASATAATPSESMASTPGPQTDTPSQLEPKEIAKASKDSKSVSAKKAAKSASASQAVKQASKKVAATTKAKSKSEEKAPRSISQVESIPPGTASVVSAEVPVSAEEDDESGTDDERIFCVCKKRYKEEEEDTTMIGCEGGCENWYHPPCVGLRDEQVDAIGTYICKECEARTGRKTTWTMACKREGCTNSTANKGSKFCSQACAFQHAQNLIPAVASKKQLKQLHDAFLAYPQPGPSVSVVRHDGLNRNGTHTLTTNPITDMSAQLKTVQLALELVQKRQRILAQAIGSWGSSGSGAANVVLDDGEQADIPPPSKKSRKHQSKEKEEKLCGWDERLVWDDTKVTIWNGEAWEGDRCGKGRRCDRHQGWQKTVTASLQVEEALLTHRSQELAAQIDQMERYDEAQAMGQQIRGNMRARLAAVK